MLQGQRLSEDARSIALALFGEGTISLSHPRWFLSSVAAMGSSMTETKWRKQRQFLSEFITGEADTPSFRSELLRSLVARIRK
jgi:hypothetical protein